MAALRTGLRRICWPAPSLRRASVAGAAAVNRRRPHPISSRPQSRQPAQPDLPRRHQLRPRRRHRHRQGRRGRRRPPAGRLRGHRGRQAAEDRNVQAHRARRRPHAGRPIRRRRGRSAPTPTRKSKRRATMSGCSPSSWTTTTSAAGRAWPAARRSRASSRRSSGRPTWSASCTRCSRSPACGSRATTTRSAAAIEQFRAASSSTSRGTNTSRRYAYYPTEIGREDAEPGLAVGDGVAGRRTWAG